MSTKYKKNKKYKKKSSGLKVYRPEMKHFTYALTTYGSVGNTWAEYDWLNAIQQGDDYNNRIGRKIAVHYFRFKGTFWGGAQGTALTDDLYNNIRLVCWTQHNNKTGAQQTPLTTATLGINSPIRKYNLPGLGKVYKDKYYALTNNPIDADTCAPAGRTVDWKIKFKKPLIVNFTNTGVHYNQTQLYIGMITDSTAIPHPGFTNGYLEVLFTDL